MENRFHPLLSPAKLAKLFRTAKIFQTQSLWGSIPPTLLCRQARSPRTTELNKIIETFGFIVSTEARNPCEG
jgi:hypothetical protein